MTEAARALLTGLIDYAGMFPPAQLPLEEAVANYERYRAGEYAWMLGRFVAPVGKVCAFDWAVAAIGTDNLQDDLALLQKQPCADVIETKVLGEVPSQLRAYFEVPVERLHEVAVLGGRAKIRTATASTAEIITFVRACDQQQIPFKATAGLHHAVRGIDPHGFLNLFLGAAFLRHGMSDITEVLEETGGQAFQFSDEGIQWRDSRLTLEQIRSAREWAAGFGSCSFEEPIADLKELRIL